MNDIEQKLANELIDFMNNFQKENNCLIEKLIFENDEIKVIVFENNIARLS